MHEKGETGKNCMGNSTVTRAEIKGCYTWKWGQRGWIRKHLPGCGDWMAEGMSMGYIVANGGQLFQGAGPRPSSFHYPFSILPLPPSPFFLPFHSPLWLPWCIPNQNSSPLFLIFTFSTSPENSEYMWFSTHFTGFSVVVAISCHSGAQPSICPGFGTRVKWFAQMAGGNHSSPLIHGGVAQNHTSVILQLLSSRVGISFLSFWFWADLGICFGQ